MSPTTKTPNSDDIETHHQSTPTNAQSSQGDPRAKLPTPRKPLLKVLERTAFAAIWLVAVLMVTRVIDARDYVGAWFFVIGLYFVLQAINSEGQASAGQRIRKGAFTFGGLIAVFLIVSFGGAVPDHLVP